MARGDQFATTMFHIAVLLHIAFTIWYAQDTLLSVRTTPDSEKDYTYIGNDYPLDYPMGKLDTVAMSLHESVRYDILDPTDEVANKEWKLLVESPLGHGLVRMGPDRRIFLLSFHHQMHCLWFIQLELMKPEPMPDFHLHHCFNYLRQAILCEAADSLEEGDFMDSDFSAGRKGSDLVCQDWMTVYDTIDEKHEEWLAWAAEWN